MTSSTTGPGNPDYEPPRPAHSPGIRILTSLSALAFCIPQNEKLTAYYDLIEKRLFDVRNCHNIEGAYRELPLYDPPIDPLLLIRARAAGLDIDSVIADLSAPLPNYRFSFTLQKALELATELKALGGALLAALEKGDAEELALLRSNQELSMLKLVREVRQKQVEEADANLLALQQSEATLLERFGQYQKLLGKPGITKGQDGLPVVEQSSALFVATDPVGAASGLGLSTLEIQQLLLTVLSNEFHQQANAIHLVAGILSLVPNIFAGTPFAGQTSGGTNWGIGTNAIAQAMEMVATEATFRANLAGTVGGYQRRQDEWVHQSKLALAELKQLEKQIIAAQIRKEIAQHELDNHDMQIENAQAVDEFMRSKFTSLQLFRWNSAQIADIYFRTYQLTLDHAKRAEKTFRFELGLDDTTAPYVKSGQWDSLKRGLLAGEHLYHDLKRMEGAYLEQNRREFELTKHISLAMLNPLAMLALREKGSCTLDLPEEIFDLDYPGHYFRRIKSVSLSMPCVVGPYTTISCTLRLTSNSIRVKTIDGTSGYARSGPHDIRFISNNIPVSAIAASGAQNDSGMFELSFRDERYLPFEGAGTVSSWSLELFNDPDPNTTDFGRPLRQFDYSTISDVILHIKYTAREGGDSFKTRAVGNLRAYFKANGKTPSLRIFNLRQEFPTQWHRFLHPADPASPNIFELEMSPDLFPFRDSDKTLKINVIYLFARCTDSGDYVVTLTPPLQPAIVSTTPVPNKLQLKPKDEYGGLHFDQRGDTTQPLDLELSPTTPPITWKLSFSGPGPNGILRLDPTKKVMEVEDVFLLLGYQWK